MPELTREQALYFTQGIEKTVVHYTAQIEEIKKSVTPFTPPECSIEYSKKIENLEFAIKAQRLRIETLRIILDGKNPAQAQMDHLYLISDIKKAVTAAAGAGTPSRSGLFGSAVNKNPEIPGSTSFSSNP